MRKRIDSVEPLTQLPTSVSEDPRRSSSTKSVAISLRSEIHEQFDPIPWAPPFRLQFAIDPPCDFLQLRPSVRQFSKRLPRPTGSIRGIKLRVIRYTWNADIPGLFKAAHKWEWEPKTNKVTLRERIKTASQSRSRYVRSELSSQSDAVKNEVEPAFVNDNYWTLFPFHAYWDKSASAIDQGKFNLPVGPGSAELVPVKYPADGGYTPGDTWDLYVGNDNRVV